MIVQNVSKQLGSKSVLEDIQLTCPVGQTTVLIGPSGCGKTTLLKLMVGLLWPDRGTILFEERPIAPNNIEKIRQRFGYVIQNGGLFPHLTAAQNVSLMTEYLGWTNEKILDRTNDLAQLTHLPAELLERYPSQLSGGQRQRVSLIRALMLDPDVLFLDEPLGALDPMIRHELQTDLRDVFRRLKKTVIMVTHDLHEAEFFADQIVLMRDGTIVQQGQLSDFTRQPVSEFVSRFVGAQGYEPISAE